MGDKYKLESRNINKPEGLLPQYYLPEGTHTGYFHSYTNPQDKLCFANYIPPNAEYALIVEVGTGHIAEDWAEMMRLSASQGIATFVHERFNHGLSSRKFGDPSKLGARPFLELADNTRQFMRDVVQPMMMDSGLRHAPTTLLGASQGGAIAILCAHENPGLFDNMALVVPMVGQHDLSAKTKWGWIADRRLRKEMKTLYGEDPRPDMVKPTEFQATCDQVYADILDNQTAMRYRDPEINPMLQCHQITLDWIEHGEQGSLLVQKPEIARAIDMPIMTIVAYDEKEKKRGGDRCVENWRTEQFVRTTPNAGMVRIDGTDHDLLNARRRVRKQAADVIHDFMRAPQDMVDAHRPQAKRWFTWGVQNTDPHALQTPNPVDQDTIETLTCLPGEACYRGPKDPQDHAIPSPIGFEREAPAPSSI